MTLTWRGVIPAITTPFNRDLSIDRTFLTEHAHWMLKAGCTGMVVGGSLGEAATLVLEEKVALVEALAESLGGTAPVIAGVASLSTADARRLVRDAEAAGAQAFMVLPPYVYSTDWREMKAHVLAILDATELPCMLYNNPPAYRTDFTPEQVAELASEHGNLEAIKESSADVRRISAIRALLADRLEILVGVDDAIVEGVAAGAVGWIAGLVNAFPVESVALFRLAQEARHDLARAGEAFELYRWFLPLLRLDTLPKFVQLIKLAQEKVGKGKARVRPPRLELEGVERAEALAIIEAALASRHALPKAGIA